MLPLEVTFRDLEPSDAVRTRIERKAAELERFDDRILSCRVLVEAHHRHHRKGRLYHVRVEIDVAGGFIVVSREPGAAHEHEDVYVAIRDAFAAAVRRVEDYVRRRRGDTKTHEVRAHGRVIRTTMMGALLLAAVGTPLSARADVPQTGASSPATSGAPLAKPTNGAGQDGQNGPQDTAQPSGVPPIRATAATAGEAARSPRGPT